MRREVAVAIDPEETSAGSALRRNKPEAPHSLNSIFASPSTGVKAGCLAQMCRCATLTVISQNHQRLTLPVAQSRFPIIEERECASALGDYKHVPS